MFDRRSRNKTSRNKTSESFKRQTTAKLDVLDHKYVMTGLEPVIRGAPHVLNDPILHQDIPHGCPGQARA
jgi:hypothetical protein